MLAEIIMQKIIILVISLFVWTGIAFSQNNQEFFLAQNSLCSYEEQGMGGDGLVIVKKQQAQTDNVKKNHKTIVCSACNGNGKIGCYLCSGTGKQSSTSYYTDGHTIISNCPVCHGTGRCGVCHETGRL